MIVLDFLLFLYGINLDELQAVKEGQEYKNELLSKELEKQKNSNTSENAFPVICTMILGQNFCHETSRRIH